MTNCSSYSLDILLTVDLNALHLCLLDDWGCDDWLPIIIRTTFLWPRMNFIDIFNDYKYLSTFVLSTATLPCSSES